MESDKPTSSSRKITSDDPAPERDRTKRKSSKKSPVNRKEKKIDKNFSKRKSNGGDSDEESIDDTRKDYAGRMPEVNVTPTPFAGNCLWWYVAQLAKASIPYTPSFMQFTSTRH